MKYHIEKIKRYKIVVGLLVAAILVVISAFLISIPAKNKPVHHSDPLSKLLEGNRRFVNNTPQHPDESKERKKEIMERQQPFAAIISCSDSRVPPEIIFDQGLGDLFIIRTAGNLIGEIELGSLEYAVTHLGIRLIVVMGHQNCGVIESFVQGSETEGYTSKLISMVKNEAGEKIALQAWGDKIDNCVWANIEHTVHQIKEASSVLLKNMENTEVKIVGAKYHLDDGKVETRVIRTIKKNNKNSEAKLSFASPKKL